MSSGATGGVGRTARLQKSLTAAVETAAERLQQRRLALALAVAPVLWLGALLPILDGASAIAATSMLVAALCWPAALFVAGQGRNAAAASPSAESLMNAVTLRLDETGEALAVSGRAQLLLGVPGEMLLGAGFGERILIADRVSFLGSLAALRDGEADRVLEARIRLPAGPGAPAVDCYRSFTIEMTRTGFAAEPILAVVRSAGETEEPRKGWGSAKDAPAQAAAESARPLAALGHELRTPLGALIGFADALKCESFGPFADARQKEYAVLIKQAGDHLLSVLDSTLQPAEAGIAATESAFDLAAALEMCVRMTERSAAAKAITLIVDADDALGTAKGSGRALQQILLNLLSNAVKFTPRGGRVTLGAFRRAGRLEVSVADTGIGIAKEHLPMLGTPFTRIRSERTSGCEGSGLGLSLVKNLVALEGGTMRIESVPEKGTTVTVALPDRTAREGAAPRRLVLLANDKSQADAAKEDIHGPIRKAG